MERAFTEPFTIGRGIQATLHVDSGRVSRLHAEVVYEGGGWVLRDAGSTNGTYHEGQRVTQVALGAETTVRLGQEGPFVYLSVTEEAGEGRARPAGSPRLESRRSFAEEDTQRQGEAYRPLAVEAPTAWHTAPGEDRAGAIAGATSGRAHQVVRDERNGPALPYGKIIAAVAVALVLLAIALVLL